MKFKTIALSLLLVFSASIPSHTKAEFSLLQLSTGLIQLLTSAGAAYYTAGVLRYLYTHRKYYELTQWKHLTNKKTYGRTIDFSLNVGELLGLAAGGSVAAATCLIAGYQAL